MMVKSGAAAVALLALAANPAWAGTCGLVIAAQVKQIHTPFRSHSVMSHKDEDDIVIDNVNTADTRYVKMSGTIDTGWTHSALNAATDEANYRRSVSAQRMSCELEGNADIAGDATDIYVTHYFGADAVASRIWISHSLGLPVKVDSFVGQNTERPGNSTATYEYKDVQPPAETDNPADPD